MKQSILIFVVLGGLLLTGCQSSSDSRKTVRPIGPPKNDVEFAKEVFRLLGEGDEAVVEMIDWEHLNMLGIDVGEMYRGVKDDANARDGFVKSFIRGYSNSFKGRGGSIENSSNWREQSRDATNTVVSAENFSGQLLLMTVTHIGGQQKVSKLELK